MFDHISDKDDPLTILLVARDGYMNYVFSHTASGMGHGDYWDLKYMGEEPCRSYVAHGNFLINSHPIFRSQLTPKGKEELARLEALRTANLS